MLNPYVVWMLSLFEFHTTCCMFHSSNCVCAIFFGYWLTLRPQGHTFCSIHDYWNSGLDHPTNNFYKAISNPFVGRFTKDKLVCWNSIDGHDVCTVSSMV